MILQKALLILPIHKSTQKKYYKDHDKYIEKQKLMLEKSWGKKFYELKQEVQSQWECLWHWPPWLFNDMAGYLEIGMDGGVYMTANIYLRTKYLPPTHWYKRYKGKYLSTLENQYILYDIEIIKRSVDLEDNSSFVIQCKGMIKEAKEILRKKKKNFHIWQLPYSLECLNFVKAYHESKRFKQMRKGKA